MRIAKNLILILVSFLFTLCIAEIVVRTLFSDKVAISRSEFSLLYQYDPLLGWFPQPNTSYNFKSGHTIHVQHNQRGFRDIEHVLTNSPRILVLGDSYVWGYKVEAYQRFTDILRIRLPDWSIYNLGVSGYGNDQEYLLLQQQYNFYQPDVVILIFSRTDIRDNTSNAQYGGYYKPYYQMENGTLSLKGVPVPKSSGFSNQHAWLSQLALIRLISNAYAQYHNPEKKKITPDPTYQLINKINQYVQKKGGKFILGLEASDIYFEEFLNEHKIAHYFVGNEFMYPYDLHWTPEGHTLVAKKILAALKSEKIID